MSGNAMRRTGYRWLRKIRAVLPETQGRQEETAGARMLRWTREKLVPRSKVWVQVERGMAQGLWMRLQLPEEMFLWRGDHEPYVQELLASFLRPGWVAYDVGSYVGVFALPIARAVGPAGKVFAFEPDPDSAARLREHVARNHLEDRVRVVEAAAWRREAGQIPYRRGCKALSQGGVEAEGTHPVLASGKKILVRSISLDAFVAQGNPAPQLLKIDVEGGEAAVMEGAEGLITRDKPLIICEVHHLAAARWMQQWLPSCGYHIDWTIPREEFPRHLVAKPAPKD